jgi:hypothetical protein
VTSYSQNGEDLIIAELFKERKQHVGRLLDIGAWDMKDLSNSRGLIEIGFSAVLIEPSPGPLRGREKQPHGLIGEYRDSEKVSVVCACVGLERGLVKVRVTDDAVSTSDEEAARPWTENNKGGYYGFCYYPVITIQDIFERFGGPFDFVNIDCEGLSVPLAIEYMKTEAYPLAICVEHNGRIPEVMEVALKRGYLARAINQENIILELKG